MGTLLSPLRRDGPPHPAGDSPRDPAAGGPGPRCAPDQGTSAGSPTAA